MLPLTWISLPARVVGGVALGAALSLLGGPPAAGAERADPNIELARVITRSFIGTQLPDGDLVDPLTGAPAQRYSQAMLANSALQIARRGGAADLRSFALRALGFIASHPEYHRAPSVFERAAVAEAYRALATTPADPVRRRLRTWLDGASVVYLRPSGRFRGNKYLVEAYGWLQMCRADLDVSRAICREAVRTIEDGLVRTASQHATRGRSGRVVVVLPDPPAYHLLTLGYLARALPLTAGRARTVRLLVALARGTVSMLAPDGDAAYWGRSQGEGWSLLLGAYGLREAALRTGDVEAARFRAAAELLVRRFRAKHVGGPYGTYLTPSFAEDPLVRPPGIDSYANVATYAGLTANVLCWLAEQQPVTTRASDGTASSSVLGGRAGDFATVRRPDVWMAVVGRTSKPGDLRYDFGLAAAKVLVRGRWRDLVLQKPMTRDQVDSAGPSLLLAGQAARPFGTRLTVARSGTVSVVGGWRAANGAVVRRTVFRFRPSARGVVVSVPVRAGDDLEYSVFSLSPSLAGSILTDGLRRTVVSMPVVWRREPGYANADHRTMTRARLGVHVSAPGELRFTHEFVSPS